MNMTWQAEADGTVHCCWSCGVEQGPYRASWIVEADPVASVDPDWDLDRLSTFGGAGWLTSFARTR